MSQNDAPNSWDFPHVHLCSTTCTSNSTDLLSHCVTQENHLEYHLNSLQRGGQHKIPFLSQIGTTHPAHGLSLRLTHSLCVLEDVSLNCNNQHSLSAREAFSIRPSLAQKYSNFILVVVINTPSQLERYYPPSQFLTEVLELRIGKRFGEDICNLLMFRKVLHV
jgi:hypothetical protein